MKDNHPNGEFFSPALQQEIKDKFHYVDIDFRGKPRLFFENAGGSFTLKQALAEYCRVEAIGDCPERTNKTADYLNEIIDQGVSDAKLILNAGQGSVVTMLTASQIIFELTRVAAESLPGGNIVTTALEHPSAFDAAKTYAIKTGREFRVARTNPVTGGVDAEEIAALVDQDTCFLSVIYASNISGAILDLEKIIRLARAKKPDLCIICDAVQHAPHALIDLQKTPVDAISFAPYKFFGVRGLGLAYVSPRFAPFAHHLLIGKPAGEWELGSPAPAQYAGVSAIVDYVCWIGARFSASQERRELFAEGMNRLHLQERALLHRLLEGGDGAPGLRHIPGVTVHLDYPDLGTRDLIVAMEMDKIGFNELVKEYERLGVAVYERVAESIYSKRMIESFGLRGAIRISPLHCHDAADIDRFLKITAELAAKLNA